MSDRIEALEARLAEVTASRERMHEVLHQTRHDRDCFAQGEAAWKDRAEAVAAERDKWEAAYDKAAKMNIRSAGWHGGEFARAEAAEAKLVEVQLREQNLHRLWLEACSRSGESQYRAEAAEAANLRFYRAGIEAGAREAGKVQFGDGTFRHRLRKARAIRALPDPTDEQMDAIRKGGE